METANIKGTETTLYYWVAVNRDSVAASGFALPETVVVQPTPQLVFGFEARKESLEIQQRLLNEPPHRLAGILNWLNKRDDVIKIKPRNPQRPTRGETAWLVG